VDDGSSDNSKLLLGSLDDERVTLLYNETNIGAGESFRRAFAASNGDWIAVVDSDDYINPTRTSRCLEHLAQNTHLQVIGTWVQAIDEFGERTESVSHAERWFNRFVNLDDSRNWIARNHLCNSSTMVRRSLYLKHGLPDYSLERTADYEFWTRLLKSGEHFGIIPEMLTTIRVHSNSVTHGDPVRAFLETSYILCKNIIPMLEKQARLGDWFSVLDWWVNDARVQDLREGQRYFILLTLLKPTHFSNFDKFFKESRKFHRLLRIVANFQPHRRTLSLYQNQNLFDYLPKTDSLLYRVARFTINNR
jgi:glycosyltransferase involved in cell wall biosynthesis